MKPKLLWVGDAVQQTGFARVTHNVLGYLREKYDVHLIGINYNGDPHPYPYPIYPSLLGGDVFGVGRFAEMMRSLRPDIAVILQDPWQVMRFLETDAPPQIPVLAYMPVDGKNFAFGPQLNTLEKAIWYTKFGQTEAEQGGFAQGKSVIIPHGVDAELYTPGDRREARAHLGILDTVGDRGFIFGNINRNTVRKRLDLTIQSFAVWWHENGRPENAWLFLHCSRFDTGYDVVQLARYYGIHKHLILSKVKLHAGQYVSERDLVQMYRSFDVQVSTTMGEGWGLTQHEGMACGIPQIVPQWSALAEWANGAVTYVPVDSYNTTPKGINVIGGIPSVRGLIKAYATAFHDAKWREEMGKKALERARLPEYRWESVARLFDQTLSDVLKGREYGQQTDGSAQQAVRGRVQEKPQEAGAAR